MKHTLTLGVLLFSLLSPLALRGEESKAEKSELDLTRRYLLLRTYRTLTMQEELNKAAAAAASSGRGAGREVAAEGGRQEKANAEMGGS